jgi:hypothetical protein
MMREPSNEKGDLLVSEKQEEKTKEGVSRSLNRSSSRYTVEMSSSD